MNGHAKVQLWLRTLVKWPTLHFVLLGALLFGLEQQLTSPSSNGHLATSPVIITAPQVEQLRKDWLRDHGRLPSRSEEQALLEELISEELLFQEALRLGLDRNDLVVYRRLTEKMRLLSGDPPSSVEQLYREAVALGLGRDDLIVRRRLVHRMRLLAAGGGVRPSEAEIQDYYSRHSERFQRPARIRLSHVFLSSQQQGHEREQEAHRVLEELELQGTAPQQVFALGDPFPIGNHLPLRTSEQLERDFGAPFAARVMAFEPDRWNGPVESVYGWHLVWVHQKQPAGRLDLETVRRQILEDLRVERRQQRLANLLQRLRSRYEVLIDFPSLDAGANREEVG